MRPANPSPHPRRKAHRTSDGDGKAPLGRGSVSLPVVAIDPKTGIKRSPAGRWRAYSLAAVHLMMILHVLHWLWAGNTLTPIEPSEAMETIRKGELNMGFLFFSAALIATLFLGRWVCGWGCHMIAYQDLTLWVLKKLGLRPKAYRTRVLIVVPFLAAAYMFLYPLGVRIWQSFEGQSHVAMSWHLSRVGFWETMPGPFIAVLTFLICGVVIIYLLGPKGFCTFACPYGAFFGLADKLAPGHIRVTDACQQCGHCTAVCTSNVRVAAEVHQYGMVVDSGCMKCLDCVHVCPNDALYFGFGKPSLAATFLKPRHKKPRYDIALTDELLALAVFGGALFATWGLYGRVPFLMSLGAAGLISFLMIKGIRLTYARDVLLQKWRLKTAGRIRSSGMAYLCGLLVLVALTLHSGIWRYHDFMANRAFDKVPADWQYDQNYVLRAGPQTVDLAKVGYRHFEACRRWGFFNCARNDLREAWLSLFTRDRTKATERMHDAIRAYPDKPDLWLNLAKIEIFLGRPAKAREAFGTAIKMETSQREALTRKAGPMPHPLSSQIWTEWGLFLGFQGDGANAKSALTKAIQLDPKSPRPRLALVDYLISSGDVDAARKALLRAIGQAGYGDNVINRLSRLRLLPQKQNLAVDDYQAALAERTGPHPLESGASRRKVKIILMHNLAHALTVLKHYEKAVEQYRRILSLSPNSSQVRADLGAVLLIQQDLPGAIREYEIILRQEPRNVEASMRLGILYLQSGRRKEAVDHLQAAARDGDAKQRQDAVMLLRQLGASPNH